jgi:uncharacterized OsmC-like protein
METMVIHVLCNRDNYNNYFTGTTQKDITQVSLGNDIKPLQLFGISLGNCLGEFVLRFLERRNLTRKCLVNMEWNTNKVGRVNISNVNIAIEIQSLITDEQKIVLTRMLHQCPIHSAISGNVEININIVKASANLNNHGVPLGGRQMPTIAHRIA